MYEIIKSVISRGDYNLADVLLKINTLWAENKINSNQRDELVELAQNGAKVENNVDVFAKLNELEQRIQALEGKTEDEVDIEEYVGGKWYRAGDKVLENGIAYECIAPEGAVCVWSPSQYPQYWRKI
jgi:hypothetical protein